jgi:hypothetical protein
MARSGKDYGFTAIRAEGGILPPEYLQTINALGAKNQRNSDYGLTKSLNIKDEIGRYWRMATDLWNDYTERRSRTDLDATKLAVDEWLRPLFEDILGYHDIVPTMLDTIGDRNFPIGHRACGGTVPLILTGHEFDLDSADPRFGDDGRRRPPYGLLQEFLNAEEACLWGIVANGNVVRVARDNPSLTRPAFVEADLQRLFDEQLFADFAAFWLTFHVSRLAPQDGNPYASILEAWRTESIETGERAREKLREGVTAALRHLGNGFLEHANNDALRTALSEGSLTDDAYFQELLRLIYRLLFLFTVEDRSLLLHPEATDDARRLYGEGYSISRLRDRALKRRHYDQYCDLWDGLLIVFDALSKGTQPLGLPALGGLFTADQCPHLDASLISNEQLLQAIRALAFFESGTVLARVNFRDMGTEELGSVYESLLELHPSVSASPWSFGFMGDDEKGSTNGSQRKLTGSYYTPPSLVNELIKSALIPVLEETLRNSPDKPREALLDLDIVDPACGSGHFLLAAARQVAAEVARLDAGPDTPDERLRQHALREVVQHCVFGVDRNPLAVELCKTALWIETVEPGKPLTFLDSHIRCGDSLIGIFDLSALKTGIPNEAFKPLTGDDRDSASYYRKKNSSEVKERKKHDPRQGALELTVQPRDLAQALEALDAMPENDVADIEAKRSAFESFQSSELGVEMKFACDLWCAAYYARKEETPLPGRELVPTTGQLWQHLEGIDLYGPLVAEVNCLATENRFFHWQLEFPDVFAKGGFDVVLGNPPWERVKLEEQEFFAVLAPEIANTKKASVRKKQIAALDDTNPRLGTLWNTAVRKAACDSAFLRLSGRYPLGGVGDVNTYAVFADHFRQTINENGRAGLILPNGLVTGYTYRGFLRHLLSTNSLASFYGFENEEKIFKSVHNETKFGLLTLTGLAHPIEQPWFTAHLRRPEEITNPERRYALTIDEIQAINPNTLNLPVFRWAKDAEVTATVHKAAPVLVRKHQDGRVDSPWDVELKRMFDLTNDSGSFLDHQDIAPLVVERQAALAILDDGRRVYPLYEGKMFWHFDHRYGTYEGQTQKQANKGVLPRVPDSRHDDPQYRIQPRYVSGNGAALLT